MCHQGISHTYMHTYIHIYNHTCEKAQEKGPIPVYSVLSKSLQRGGTVDYSIEFTTLFTLLLLHNQLLTKFSATFTVERALKIVWQFLNALIFTKGQKYTT